jgi:hypothetical protein
MNAQQVPGRIAGTLPFLASVGCTPDKTKNSAILQKTLSAARSNGVVPSVAFANEMWFSSHNRANTNDLGLDVAVRIAQQLSDLKHASRARVMQRGVLAVLWTRTRAHAVRRRAKQQQWRRKQSRKPAWVRWQIILLRVCDNMTSNVSTQTASPVLSPGVHDNWRISTAQQQKLDNGRVLIVLSQKAVTRISATTNRTALVKTSHRSHQQRRHRLAFVGHNMFDCRFEPAEQQPVAVVVALESVELLFYLAQRTRAAADQKAVSGRIAVDAAAPGILHVGSQQTEDRQ